MPNGFLPRITGSDSRLPGRGKAFVKVTMLDENGFTYEYRELEVEMGVARETIAQLHLHAGATSEQAAPAGKRSRARGSRRKSA